MSFYCLTDETHLYDNTIYTLIKINRAESTNQIIVIIYYINRCFDKNIGFWSIVNKGN